MTTTVAAAPAAAPTPDVVPEKSPGERRMDAFRAKCSEGGIAAVIAACQRDAIGKRELPRPTQDEMHELVRSMPPCELQKLCQRRGQPMPLDERGFPLCQMNGRIVSTDPDHDCHRNPTLKIPVSF